MSKLRVLIAGDNIQYSALLQEAFTEAGEFEVVYTANNGRAALEYLENSMVEVIVLDLIMPILDGIEVLSRLKENDKYAGIYKFASSSLLNDNLISLAQSLGANYFFARPVDPMVMINRIMYIIESSSDREKPVFNNYKAKMRYKVTNNAEELAVNYLRLLGVPANINGYKYLRSAIMYVINKSPQGAKLTTDVYPKVAVEYNSTATRVERSIRHAIEVTWNRGNISAQTKLFGYTINDNKGCPTNGELISMIADKVITTFKYR